MLIQSQEGIQIYMHFLEFQWIEDVIAVWQNQSKCNQLNALKCHFRSKLTVVHVDSTGELPLHAGISCVKSLYMFGDNVLLSRKLAWLILHTGRHSIGKSPAILKG